MSVDNQFTLVQTAFGEIRIRSGVMSPFTHGKIESLAEDLFKEGFRLKEIIVEKRCCPTCQRTL